ncbi:CPBP family intramembrane glutamic endopeptidase [Bradyrhizobium sp. CCGUVB23]|uniref:CPBP family intramembrane glutamic endopeptidase n=1 Tax=Bradyrhizobium sp. CCGUVB23 TaxID=2949630 RepID=UPI0020B44B67|nr:CPBP family intramembrane glutamic endopeptidase [Bradyrhizobium sp. CCGUVB23]MCP3467167.1 CPBP family intramembrane metalloprotease [Bradyrhizobium sp. CCGUVB23]
MTVSFIVAFFIVGLLLGASHLIVGKEVVFAHFAVFLISAATSAVLLYFDRRSLKHRVSRLLPELAAGVRSNGAVALVALCIPLGVFGTFYWGLTGPKTITNGVAIKSALANAPLFLWIGKAATIVLLVPFAEEMFYRGYVWDRLSTAMTPVLVGAISAALFLAAHVLNGIAYPLYVLPITAILTAIRLQGVGLSMCLLAHVLYNAVNVLGTFVQVHDGVFRALIAGSSQ